jgi:endoglucanase
MKQPRLLTRLVQFSVLLLFARSLPAQSGPTQAGVAERRMVHLKHGINASQWFAQVYDPKGYSKEHFESWMTPNDMVLIKRMGFDNVRLSVNPQPMFLNGHADELPPGYLAYLDAAVKMILDQGLAVTIDIHPDSDFKARLANQDDFVEQFCEFWRALARHYANLDPDLVFFEMLNEPEMRDRYRWQGIQAKVAAAIREGAPQHTLIAAGANFSADDELLFLEPLPDPNVIYNFHFYDPHVFTHQGATWGVNFWHNEKSGLAYPSNRESAEKVAAQVPEEVDRLYILRYGMEHWDAARIDGEILQVADWARRRNLAVLCNEFGVYRKYAAPQDRAAWIRDVRTSLEHRGMGWAMWDYNGGFGVVTKSGATGAPVPDEVTLKALGLR